MDKHSSYQAALQNLRPLQSHCDAVEKDEDEDHIVKELMGNNGLAEQSEPDKKRRGEVRYCPIINVNLLISYPHQKC